MIIDHTHPESLRLTKRLGRNRYNGAYFYSCEIVEHIIPNVKTDRNWMTIRAGAAAVDHSIVFVHDLWKFPEKYGYTFPYDDMLYVVGVPDMLDEVSRYGKAIYLPLSVDVGYVELFKRDKDRDAAFCGRTEWRTNFMPDGPAEFPDGTDFLELMPRPQLLSEMARYRTVYAECRTAIEAKVLGCEVIGYHPRFAGKGLFDVLDSKDAAVLLQEQLDRIDG